VGGWDGEDEGGVEEGWGGAGGSGGGLIVLEGRVGKVGE